MTDKITKALGKLSDKEKRQIKMILEKIKSDKLDGLDIKRLKGHKDIFRVRKNDLRVIYRTSDKGIKILAIERRSEKTYRNY